MPFRRILIFWSLDIFHVKDSTVSPFGPLSDFCFVSRAQFEGINETLLYSVELSSFGMMVLKPHTLLASTLDIPDPWSRLKPNARPSRFNTILMHVALQNGPRDPRALRSHFNINRESPSKAPNRPLVDIMTLSCVAFRKSIDRSNTCS
jgi:hypothetical protein